MSQSSAKKKSAAQTNAVDYREVAKIAAILTAICLVVALALAGTNMLTADIIAEAAQAAKEETCRAVVPADSYVYLTDEYDGFDGYDVYLAVTDGVVSGAAITTSSKGYGGAVQVMTGIDATGRVAGVSILEHSETAGLGANAEKPKFLNQFITGGEQLQPETYAVTKDGGNIDAVTAATRTSRAVCSAVTEALEVYRSIQAAGVIGSPVGAPGQQPAPVSPSDAVSDSDIMGGAEIE